MSAYLGIVEAVRGGAEEWPGQGRGEAHEGLRTPDPPTIADRHRRDRRFPGGLPRVGHQSPRLMSIGAAPPRPADRHTHLPGDRGERLSDGGLRIAARANADLANHRKCTASPIGRSPKRALGRLGASCAMPRRLAAICSSARGAILRRSRKPAETGRRPGSAAPPWRARTVCMPCSASARALRSSP